MIAGLHSLPITICLLSHTIRWCQPRCPVSTPPHPHWPPSSPSPIQTLLPLSVHISTVTDEFPAGSTLCTPQSFSFSRLLASASVAGSFCRELLTIGEETALTAITAWNQSNASASRKNQSQAITEGSLNPIAPAQINHLDQSWLFSCTQRLITSTLHKIHNSFHNMIAQRSQDGKTALAISK